MSTLRNILATVGAVVAFRWLLDYDDGRDAPEPLRRTS